MFLTKTVVIIVDAEGEASQVTAQLQKISEAGKGIANSLWSFESMTCTIVTLEDRLEQETELVRMIKMVMTGIFASLFPTNPPPSSIFVLVNLFFRPDGRLWDFAQDKLCYGAKVALAFVRAHHPDADVDSIAKGIPLDMQGNPVDMEGLLPLVKKAAEQIIEHLELEPKAEEEDQSAQS